MASSEAKVDKTPKEASNDGDDDSYVNYGGSRYWDDRYSRDASAFDWLVSWGHFREHGFVDEIGFEKDKTVLMLGCGSADFSSDMYDDGYTQITNIDLSSVIIDQMRTRNAARLGMTWYVMDVQDLQFSSRSFDIVIDKSTMDCLFCCDDSWTMCRNMLLEAFRVLKPYGVFVCISLHPPKKVMEFVEPFGAIDWDISHRAIPNKSYTPGSRRSENYYVFICRRNGRDPAATDRMLKRVGSARPSGIPTDAGQESKDESKAKP